MQDTYSQHWLKSCQGSEESSLPSGNFVTAKTQQELRTPLWVEVLYATDERHSGQCQAVCCQHHI